MLFSLEEFEYATGIIIPGFRLTNLTKKFDRAGIKYVVDSVNPRVRGIQFTMLERWEEYIYDTVREYVSTDNYNLMIDVLDILEIPTRGGDGSWSHYEIKSIMLKVERHRKGLEDPYEGYVTNIFDTRFYKTMVESVITELNNKHVPAWKMAFILNAKKYPYFTADQAKWTTGLVRKFIDKIE